MYHLPAQENQSSVEGQDTPAGADYHRSVHGIRSGLPYLFPILYDPEKKTEREYSSALRVYNKRLDSLSSLLELDEPLTSYTARHTWASLARQCGTSDTVISEAMGHSHVGVTTIYLASLDIGMVAMANQRVITSLFRKRIP